MNLICASCDQEVYEILKSFSHGGMPHAECFKSLNPSVYTDPFPLAVMNCPICREFLPIKVGIGRYRMKTTEGILPKEK